MKNKYLYVDDEIQILVSKHGSHNQKTHGNWATGSEGKTLTGLIDKLSEKKTPGFSIDIRTKKSPKSGYMCSIAGAEKQIKLDEWNALGRDGQRSAIEQYKADNMEALSKRGAYFGAWKSPEDGVVYLDVSRRYESKSEGVSAGYKNSQKSIYDVANDRYIYMEEENGGREANKARAGGIGKAVERDDTGGIERVDGRDSSGDRGQFLEPHVCLGRAITVIKHQEGQHDQSTHGNWAAGKYPSDSVKAARDGALDYAYKKGLDYNKDIDYSKVVANRERASNIADIYEELPKMDRDAVDEYEALASEVEEQFDFMTKNLGIKVEFVSKDPYKNSKDMFADVSTGKLKVLQTASTGAHPLFSDAQNDKFRAVHDFFGHAATGRGFGQDGEEAAWVHHSQMFTEKARAALTTETRGQNSFFNNRGKQFADQKVALLPEEYWQVPATFSKSITIRFEYGLKPVFKHDAPAPHEQSSHGNWAHGAGYTQEQAEGIARFENVGPSLDDLDKALEGIPVPTYDDLREFVLNDGEQYDEMSYSQDLDERVRESTKKAEERLGRPLTDQEKANIYEQESEYAVKNYILQNQSDLANLRNQQMNLIDDPESLAEPFNDVFFSSINVVEPDGNEYEMYSKVEEVNMDDEGIHVKGNIYADGQAVGNFERLFFKEGETWVVEHKWLDIEDNFQGKGFGKEFLQQAEDYYTAKGFGYIKLMAGLDDGARHWARAGFDWDPDGIRSSAEKLKSARNYALNEEEKPAFDAIFERMYDSNVASPPRRVRDMRNPDFPMPAEFANLGWEKRVRDADGEWDWAGKRLMQGLVMDYVKPLTAEGRNLLSGPIDRDGDGLIYDGTGRERPAPKQ